VTDLPAHEATARSYAADSADVVLRRALTAVLAEFDAMRTELDQLKRESNGFCNANAEKLAIVEAATALVEHGVTTETYNTLVAAVEEGNRP